MRCNSFYSTIENSHPHRVRTGTISHTGGVAPSPQAYQSLDRPSEPTWGGGREMLKQRSPRDPREAPPGSNEPVLYPMAKKGQTLTASFILVQ